MHSFNILLERKLADFVFFAVRICLSRCIRSALNIHVNNIHDLKANVDENFFVLVFNVRGRFEN